MYELESVTIETKPDTRTTRFSPIFQTSKASIAKFQNATRIVMLPVIQPTISNRKATEAQSILTTIH
ncbi:MAG: hypothetical protein OEY39_07145 [Candidatus Bathyarchaeota archaeon]|nr:hypothetical protein [Candidatus Bathyarchaeota archaeon]